MALGWMEDLSEDWIEQPRSSSPPTSPSPLRDSRRKSILSERSQNRSNIAANSVQRPRHGLSRRSLSDASNASQTRYDTTARKSVSVSPPKARRDISTPEWRRRLLQGEMGAGEQKDLFSPMAIENIFQRPAPRGSLRQTQKAKPRGLAFLKSVEQIPSSPPPWPLPMPQPSHGYPRLGTMNKGDLTALDEEEEENGTVDDAQDHGSEHQKKQDNGLQQYLPGMQRQASSSNGSVVHNTVPPTRKVSFDSVRLRPASRLPSASVSWNITQGSDDFSPVYISKHNTSDGRIAYAAIDLSKSELAERLKRLHDTQASRATAASQSTQNASFVGDESSIARLESENLPEDLPVGTPDLPDVASIGDFVEIKRGGYSNVGSFRRRPLSPSPLARPVSASIDDSTAMQSKYLGLDYSELPPAAPTPPAVPKTPQADRQGHLSSPQKTKSSNSPLKLFGNHDTFTSNRLQRRISQLEQPELDQIQEHIISPSRRATGDLSAVEEHSFVPEGIMHSDRNHRLNARQSSIQQYFGHGTLDDHEFNSRDFPSPRGSDNGGGSRSRSVSPDYEPPGYHPPFRFQVDEPPADFIDTFKGKRKSSKGSTSNNVLSVAKRSDRNRPTLAVIVNERVVSHPSQISQVSEGKRPLTPSPFKSPTPKRRRTIFHSEMPQDTDLDRADHTQETHASFQRALSRKRKDARHGTERNLADPDILAQREILRPRNPTPSQRRRQEAERIIREADMYRSSSPDLDAIQEQLSVPPRPGESAESVQVRAVANHLAVLSEDVAQRKKSVTTQDFLDDAMKVMHFIRTQCRPNSNLASVNEQDSEQILDVLEESLRDDAEHQKGWSIDRPPSREGRTNRWRTGKQDQLDPRVVSHLRRFREEDDEDAVSESLRSVSRCSEPIQTVMSDPPGIQIMGQTEEARARNRSPSTAKSSHKAHDSSGTNGTKASKATHSSHTSMDSTMGRTTASRKSENVATLAPDAVAHLIPEQIAGMTYDKEQGRWVRAKKKEAVRNLANEHSGMTGSDNDPFGDIPDLTVDSLEETKHLLLSRSAGRRPLDHPPEGASALLNDLGSRPASRDDVSPPIEDVHPSPRASPSPRPTMKPYRGHRTVPVEPLNADRSDTADCDDDVEHEFSILEGRPLPALLRPKIAVSMSSPAWPRSRSGFPLIAGDRGVSTRDYAPRKQPWSSAFRLPDPRQLSVSVRVSGTVTTKDDHSDVGQYDEQPCQGDVTFYLSNLPDFTVNQIDEREIPQRVLTKRNTVVSPNKGVEDRYASGNHLLVKALQDAEPDEPYWEDLRKLVVREKALTSLHLLDLFCDQLEKLDVSRNALSQLDGAPHMIRCLQASHNMLNGLTAWAHLSNLQYLDVSHNRIDSLEGFASMIHLRELRADGNSIKNLRGIENLDGLLRLSLRDNGLQEVDFNHSNLQRLEFLDLGANKLLNVRGLDQLTGLTHLLLGANELKSFPQEAQTCTQLQHLDLAHNGLSELHMVEFSPRLQHLNVDGNRLSTIHGVEQLKQLRSLSMRAQTPSVGRCDIGPILQARMPSLTSLFLSENATGSFVLAQDWYALRTLEIAGCGLQELPEDFGLRVPNLQVLNLNFNAIKDLRPLLNIMSLTELHAAGNRLARLRKTAAVLSKLKALEMVDLRDNPFCLGFYPKAVENRVMAVTAAFDEKEQDDKRIIATPSEELESKMRFTLPPCNGDADEQFAARLDDGTKLRRRVYEMLLANNCSRLVSVDGCQFSREKALVRDEIWDRLVLLGVLKKSGRVVEDGVKEDAQSS